MEPAAAPTPKMIRQKPPHVPNQVRSWKGRNAMPSDSVEVHVLDAVAVDVDFVIAGQALDAFGDAAFGAMTLINKRGDNGNAWSGHEQALWADLHNFAPALEHKQAPDPRPADGGFRPLVAAPEIIHRSELQNLPAAETLLGERFLHRAMQISRDPSLERKRKRPFPPRFQVFQKIPRKKTLCGVQEKTFLLDAGFRWHRKQKLDDAVRHARGIEITQQSRLEVRMNIHESEPLQEVFALDKF